MTDHKISVEMLQKAAAAMEKLPDNFSLIGICLTDENGEEPHIGLHVYADKPDSNGLPQSDETALHDYAMRAGIKLWLEKAKGGIAYDYIHAMDENGTELYQGVTKKEAE